jgi:uroporphyrinogen decarboxylase
MNKREVIRTVFAGGRPPYVPWWLSFTNDANEKLKVHFGKDLDRVLDSHVESLGHFTGWTELPNHRVRDYFGVIWDRSVDTDIGVVENCLLPEPTLTGFSLPDPLDAETFAQLPAKIAAAPDKFRVFMIGFSLYERAWTLRGMENLMMDFMDNPQFVHDLLDRICDYNITQVKAALQHDIDAVYFGDDWGQQHGLQMGYAMWKEFIYPRLRRMYGTVREAGKFVMIHSCGDVDELFDDLIGIGVNCFNPFQPEVMDVWSLLPKYRGRLAFHGGLSTQHTLPYGSPADVRNESQRLIDLGRAGGYIFSAAHAVEGDVPLENLLAMIEVAIGQRNH